MINEVAVTENITTNDLKAAMMNRLRLLMDRKITPEAANAAARLGTVIVDAQNVELAHHRLRPARGQSVRPVVLVRARRSIPALESKAKRKK